ncbi:rhomboid family intramembrane serine protease [Microcoleus sp. FACHB-68]|uniref:rhomboid family intramembrane serine protease n=1 Tax=Microcoleus sp. FACHB-68 TaxID=2692826 RepID=UPI00168416E6|nr:rhomboid family intramembrane serine protease [Microcoleus sp. FACHB-68]MBD1936628.1 rhomboid family intramembrane serine protease [Microcoleus sp. FACHB-68]
MIPISDNLPNSRFPLVTYLLIGFTIALFFWELKLEVAGELSDFLLSWGVVPARLHAVAKDAIASGNPAAWFILLFMSSRSLLSGIFLHGSFSQILGNLLFLWVFGKRVEELLGHGRFLGFYLICGLLTGIVQILVEPALSVPLVGANGAIAGVLGAYLVKFSKAKIDSILPLVVVFIPMEIPAFLYSILWFIQQLFYSIGQLLVVGGVNFQGIGYWAHGVGLLIGAGLVPLMGKPLSTIVSD